LPLILESRAKGATAQAIIARNPTARQANFAKRFPPQAKENNGARRLGGPTSHSQKRSEPTRSLIRLGYRPPMKDGIERLNKIQEVYLDKSISIAWIDFADWQAEKRPKRHKKCF
jgi:hypothetical protein